MPANEDSQVHTESDPLLQPARPRDPDSDDRLEHIANVVQPSRKWIVEPVALLFCIGMMSQIPVVTQYLYYRVGQQYNETVNFTRAFVCNSSAEKNASEHQLTSRIQSEASQWTLYRNIVASAVSLLVLPIYGSSSDYLGRKPALLLPCAGMSLDAVGLLVVQLLDLPLVWVIASGGVGALGGGFGALFAAIFAYLADTTTRKERPIRVAIVEGTFGLGGAAMGLLMGWWIRLMGYTVPLIFSGSVILANLVYVVFLVPEVRLRRKSLTGDRATSARNTLRVLLSPFSNIASLFGASARLAVTLGLLLAALGIFSASFIGSSLVSSLYQMNYPFCLDSVFIGYLDAAKIVGFQIGVVVGLLFLRKCLGVKPLGLTVIGLLSSTVGSLATGVAGSTQMLFVAAAVSLFSMLPIPMLRAYTSQIAPSDKQGALFSCIGILEVSGNLAGSMAFTVLYKNTQDWMPGFVYLAVSCTTLVALLLTVVCLVVNRCWPLPKRRSFLVGDANSNMPVAAGSASDDAETRAVNYDI